MMLELAPEKQVEERRQVCEKCEYRGAAPVIPVAICTLCRCPIGNKTKILNQKCPLGKW